MLFSLSWSSVFTHWVSRSFLHREKTIIYDTVFKMSIIKNFFSFYFSCTEKTPFLSFAKSKLWLANALHIGCLLQGESEEFTKKKCFILWERGDLPKKLQTLEKVFFSFLVLVFIVLPFLFCFSCYVKIFVYRKQRPFPILIFFRSGAFSKSGLSCHRCEA